MIPCKYSNETIKKLLIVSTIVLAVFAFQQISFAAMPKVSLAAVKQQTFSSADAAAQAFVNALKNGDDSELLKILGPEGKKLLHSGDPVDDKEQRDNFLRLYSERNVLVKSADRIILHVGTEDFPFPIPFVSKDNSWFFDTGKGREEILKRRIGKNELDTIQTLLAIVDAQREYVSMDQDGDGLLTYAPKLASDKGKKNGLYWETREDEKPSPLGNLIAKARDEGYMKGNSSKPFPYNGYFFRILTKQGKNADGGAFDYIVHGHMMGGFAVVAHPAAYGRSGVMTFIVNHDGVVFQKDLGSNTFKIATSITAFDPGPGWKKVQGERK